MAALPPVPAEVDYLTVLRAFLLSILPPGVEVVRGQVNRVSEPVRPDFVVMTPINWRRLETNVDSYVDCAFMGSTSGLVLNVTSMRTGVIAPGAQLLGANVLPGTTVSSFGTGSGGVGTYNLSASQAIASQVFATGVQNLVQPVQITVQCDVHGPASADNAQTISTLFRDDYASLWLSRSPTPSTIYPLHADDPRQMPFLNAEQQFENRWIVDVAIQVNQTVTLPQDFADQVTVTTLNVG